MLCICFGTPMTTSLIFIEMFQVLYAYMDLEKFAPGGPRDLLSIGQRMLDPIV